MTANCKQIATAQNLIVLTEYHFHNKIAFFPHITLNKIPTHSTRRGP